MRCTRLIVLAVFCAMAFVSPSPIAQASSFIAAGFEEQRNLATLSEPVDLEFLPDGRLLVIQRSGDLLVFSAGTLALAGTTELRARICPHGERGLLGLAIDPNFTTPGSNWIYLFYTYLTNTPPKCDEFGGSANRVSRFKLNGNVLDTSTEEILMDKIATVNGNHNSGDLGFGSDGLLYISTGDGGCDYTSTAQCVDDYDAGRGMNNLFGKILRLTPGGGIPASNPYQGTNTARCNGLAGNPGNTTPGTTCQEIYAFGFRNPFRFAFDPNAATTRLLLNDVGQREWEEVNVVEAGKDYGWPCLEAARVYKTNGACNPPPPNMTAPLFSYAHTTTVPGTTIGNCGAITAATFVPAAANWPAPFGGSYLFADYVCGAIMGIDDSQASPTSANLLLSDPPPATGAPPTTPTAMIFGPDGAGQSLYYVHFLPFGQGDLRRIRYVGTGVNRAPQPIISVTPRSGQAPLLVTLDGSASTDPDVGDTLTYAWNFGDGTTATTAVAQHTYTQRGRWLASLTVTDRDGLSETATITVDVDGPVVTIVQPSANSTFGVGEQLTLQATATDTDGTPLTGNQVTYTWVVLLHHRAGLPDAHTHPYAVASGASATITGPTPEDFDAITNSFIEIRVTATADGLTGTASRIVQPRKVAITLDTQPTGLRVSVDGTSFVGRQTFQSWDGYSVQLEAQAQRIGINSFSPTGWSNGGAPQHTFTTPNGDRVLIANFDESFLCLLPQVQR